jgi:hypothetical protein
MDPVIISWTPTNWVTVVLMVLGAALIVKVVTLAVRKVTTGSTQ